jgi:DNA helicase HerA-like ATPase
MKYQIGKVIEVRGDQIIVALIDFDEASEAGVPEAMIVDVPTAQGPIGLLIGQPGSFVELALPSGTLVCLVTETRMRETGITQAEERASLAEQAFLIERTVRVLVTIPVGTLTADGEFERGANVLPTVSSPVFAVLPSTIDHIYSTHAAGNFSIGRLALLPEHQARINLDAFLGRHSAILGQTGGGKSWSVASILQKIAGFPQSSVVVFDLHGEYTNAFGDEAEILSASGIEMPYWLMNAEELLDLMIDRAESSAPNQNAKFKELLQHEKETHPENQDLEIEKITIDTPVFFSLQNIVDEFRRLDTEMVAGARSGGKAGPLHGQFTRLLMRLESRLNDKRYDLVFNPQTYASTASMDALFRKILGEGINRKKIIVVDMSSIPFDVRGSVISLMLRCLFDFAYWHFRVFDRQYPIAVFADEAHLYLSDEPRNYASRQSAERIAKEGRKYGVSLNVISQRPREVSSTILSQCGSFLCLRISNPEDQTYVRNLLPDSVRGITSMFSSLRVGEGVLIGDSILMPTRISIDEPEPAPASNNARFSEMWRRQPTDLDVPSVLRAWRNQKVV